MFVVVVFLVVVVVVVLDNVVALLDLCFGIGICHLSAYKKTVHVLIPGLLLCVDDKPIASQWDCDVLQGTMVWTLTNLQMGSPFQAIFQDDINNTSSGDSEGNQLFHLNLLVIILINESRSKISALLTDSYGQY